MTPNNQEVVHFKGRTFRAVIFDCDGVTVDSEEVYFQAGARLFAEHGIDLARADFEKGMGTESTYITYPMEKHGLQGVTLEEMMIRMKKHYRDIAATDLRPVPGFLSLIRNVRSTRVKTALASSSPNAIVEFNLQTASVETSLFDVIVDGDSVTRKKPHPDLFLRAAEELSVAPNDCMVIENSPAGVTAAVEAGMFCVALANPCPAARLQHADYVVRSLDEISF